MCCADYGLLKRKIGEAHAMRKRQNVKHEVVTAMTVVFQGIFDHELERVRLDNLSRASLHKK